MRINLNNEWLFKPEFNERMLQDDFDFSTFEQIRIPHTSKLLPYNYIDENSYQMLSTYRKTIFIEKEFQDKNLFITFNGVAHLAKVYINKSLVKTNNCGYLAFQFNLKDYVQYGKTNEILVVVDSRENLNQPPFGNVIDYLTYGGIYRNVYLEVKNLKYLEDVYVYTQNELTKPILNIEVKTAVKNPQFACKIFKDNTCIDSFNSDQNNFSHKLVGYQLWDINHPNLYQLELTLLVDEKIVDIKKVEFGIRKCEFLADGFYLNGIKTKIVGLNRHQSYPYIGYAMVKSGQYEDARILKEELGVNAVRTSHYPQSQDFIQSCDRLGLLVFTEIPGWQYIGDQAWQTQALKNVKNMVLQYRNHPSIVLWGVRINESADNHDFYQQANLIAKRYDKIRATGGVRCIKNSELLEDVYTYNDFVHTGNNQGIEKRGQVTNQQQKAYLISEFNGHMFPCKNYDPERIRVEHSLRYAQVLNDVNKNQKVAGSFGWCMFDYNTHKDFGSGDSICYHGVMDSFRNPKLASFVYTSQSEKIPVLEISSNMAIGEYPGANRPKIYAYTNLDSVRVYRDKVFIKEFFPENSPYKHLKHPPIVIDDLIGNLLVDNEKLTPKLSENLKKLFKIVIASNKTFKDYLFLGKMLVILKSNHISFDKVRELFNKYVNNWGNKQTEYSFDGIKNNLVVKSITKTAFLNMHLSVKISNLELVDDETYDIACLRFQMLDQNNNLMTFCNDVISLSTKGNIEVIGPSLIPLRGGCAGSYIKTTSKGEGVITICCNHEEFKYNVNII